MGSMTKFDSERRDVVRERRNARIERKQQRRQARERKRSQIGEAPPAPSAIQRAGQEQVDAAVDRIVSEALERHDQITAIASATDPASATRARDRTRPTRRRAVNGARARRKRAPAPAQRTRRRAADRTAA